MAGCHFRLAQFGFILTKIGRRTRSAAGGGLPGESFLAGGNPQKSVFPGSRHCSRVQAAASALRLSIDRLGAKTSEGKFRNFHLLTLPWDWDRKGPPKDFLKKVGEIYVGSYRTKR